LIALVLTPARLDFGRQNINVNASAKILTTASALASPRLSPTAIAPSTRAERGAEIEKIRLAQLMLPAESPTFTKVRAL
jgi:hypothetical protein